MPSAALLPLAPAPLAAAAGGLLSLLLTAAAAGAVVALGLGLREFQRRRGAAADGPLPPLLAPGPGPGPAPAQAAPRAGAAAAAPAGPPAGADLARGIAVAFESALASHAEAADLWAAFDQLVREVLTEHLAATRVRCYHVRPGSDTLQTIAQTRAAPPAAGPSLRAGVLGHVATSGQEFVAGDPAHGELVEHLAAASDERWTWVWPVRDGRVTVGVLAVGNLRDPGVLTADIRQTVGRLVSLCWLHVACLEQLRIARRTDRGSGVLTRGDFFTLAGHALADSYRESEPVVMAVLALEGLRRLDDAGRWHDRDALVKRVGGLVARRVRSDDLVGRFADDRFVVLLRRLDSGLGRLIAEKLLAGAGECVEQLAGVRGHVRLRVGLAGSGLGRPGLEELLVGAFRAVERARRADVAIRSDLEEAAEAGDGGAGAARARVEAAAGRPREAGALPGSGRPGGGT